MNLLIVVLLMIIPSLVFAGKDDVVTIDNGKVVVTVPEKVQEKDPKTFISESKHLLEDETQRLTQLKQENAARSEEIVKQQAYVDKIQADIDAVSIVFPQPLDPVVVDVVL